VRCGLRGNPDQAYAAELAQHGFLTIAPDTRSAGEQPIR
jgi:hypothetical protein